MIADHRALLVSSNRIDFYQPVRMGDKLHFVSQITYTGRTSIGVPGLNVPVDKRELDKESIWDGARSTSLSQVVNLLRQIEVAVANGKTTALACKEAGIVEQTYFRWRKEYGGLQVDQAKRLKELEQENSKLKRLVANLSLDNLVLKDFASGNF